tara:strand:- start:470 stop:961 length:492 start_codon:yes stop_codon:yes gene_type:complete
MATRSIIGILHDNNTIESIYCHFDGYPSNTGYFLLTYYNTKQKVLDLISKGDLSSLASSFDWNEKELPKIDNKIQLTPRHYSKRKDQPEPSTRPIVHDIQCNFFNDLMGEEFKYLYIPEDRKDALFTGWKCWNVQDRENRYLVNIPKTNPNYCTTKFAYSYSY